MKNISVEDLVKMFELVEQAQSTGIHYHIAGIAFVSMFLFYEDFGLSVGYETNAYGRFWKYGDGGDNITLEPEESWGIHAMKIRLSAANLDPDWQVSALRIAVKNGNIYEPKEPITPSIDREFSSLSAMKTIHRIVGDDLFFISDMFGTIPRLHVAPFIEGYRMYTENAFGSEE